MFNSFKGGEEPEKPDSSQETQEISEATLDRHTIKTRINTLLSISTLALAHLFTPQVAEAKDGNSVAVENSTATTTTKTPEDILEAKSYQRILVVSHEMREGVCKDTELTKCIDDLLTIVPKDEHKSDDAAYFDTGESGTFVKDPFINMDQLDLVLKNFKNPNTFKADELKPKIDIFSAKLSSKEYEKSFRTLQKEIEGLEGVFSSRPHYSIRTTESNLTYRGGLASGKKHLGYGLLETKKVSSEINTELPNKNTTSVGNKEIYVLMKAMEPLGKELGRRFSTMMGCDVHSVETNTNLLSSVHLQKGGEVSEIPFNNVHPIFTIEACQKTYNPEAKTPIKMSPFISIFNNSNGYGAPDLNNLQSTETGRAQIFNSDNGITTDMKWKEKSKTIPDTNRLIVTAGVKIDIPILNTNINFVPKIGVQYGYTVGKTKITPMASFSLVYKKEGSPLNGFEIGLLPAVTKGENSPNVIYFSTKYSMTF